MQQIDWSKAPDGTTHASQDENCFYFYKDIDHLGYEWFKVSKDQHDQLSLNWQRVPGKPSIGGLIERPFKDMDKLNLIATMKKRPIDSWSSGDCTTLPSGWVWVAVCGMHPHFDKLKRLSDCTIVDFADVHGMIGVFEPQVEPPASLQKVEAAIETLNRLGYTYYGGELWKPPIGKTPDHIEYDAVKSPKHYMVVDGIESIEIIAASLAVDEWRGFCLGNIVKYRLRAGKKDKLEQDISKADEYESLFERLKHLCRVER